jgi:hypothetical protein
MPKKRSPNNSPSPRLRALLRDHPLDEDLSPALRDILLREFVYSRVPDKTTPVFTEAHWNTIRSLRNDWPTEINWQRARERIESGAQFFLWIRRARLQVGTPAKSRATLNGLLRQTRALRAALTKAAALGPFGEHYEPLEQLEKDLAIWLLVHKSTNSREDFGRDWLYVWMLNTWYGPLRGELSFSRKLDGTPYGALIDFMTLTVKTIVGRAPSPHGLAKVITHHRDLGDLPPRDLPV